LAFYLVDKESHPHTVSKEFLLTHGHLGRGVHGRIDFHRGLCTPGLLGGRNNAILPACCSWTLWSWGVDDSSTQKSQLVC